MRKLGLQSMSCFCAGSLPLSGSLSLYCFSLQLLFFIVVNKISIYLSIYLSFETRSVAGDLRIQNDRPY